MEKRQKIQYELAFAGEGGGEAPRAPEKGSKSTAVKLGTESQANTDKLIEEACEKENVKEGLRRVKANAGAAGVDGMTVKELPDFLRENWPWLKERLLTGTYRPQPARRVEIPKSGGGMRKLGIPTEAEALRGNEEGGGSDEVIHIPDIDGIPDGGIVVGGVAPRRQGRQVGELVQREGRTDYVRAYRSNGRCGLRPLRPFILCQGNARFLIGTVYADVVVVNRKAWVFPA